MLREASIHDSDRAVALLALVNPEFVFTPAGFRHNWESSPPEARRKWWAVERADAIVGWAVASRMIETSEPGVGWLDVSVHPNHRTRGLGTALLEVAEAHASEIGITKLLVHARSDEATRAFAIAMGYTQTGSAEILSVDPGMIKPPVPPDGVEIRPYSTFYDDPTPIHHVDATAFLDEPGEAHFDVMPYDYWLQRFFRHPSLAHEASMVVLVDGTAAATTMLHIDPSSGRGMNNGTGTLPEYRGRGLATLAKQASLARAAELGCTVVYTGNDATNAAMLAINRKLGYRTCTTELSWSKPLAATSEP
ncbi:MAG: GNAT family N-acetyltransferase [Gaiellaceae bacterium]